MLKADELLMATNLPEAVDPKETESQEEHSEDILEHDIYELNALRSKTFLSSIRSLRTMKHWWFSKVQFQEHIIRY